MRRHVVDVVRGAVDHASSAEGGAETAAFAAEGYEPVAHAARAVLHVIRRNAQRFFVADETIEFEEGDSFRTETSHK